jgi:hypothetical protein
VERKDGEMTDDEIIDEYRKGHAKAALMAINYVDPYWVSDSGDETKPSETVPVIEEIYQRPESEEEKKERLCKLVQEFSSN